MNTRGGPQREKEKAQSAKTRIKETKGLSFGESQDDKEVKFS